MKSWLRLHRYLGVFCAPMLILFAVSGSWQLVNAHKQKKNESAAPPVAVKAISDLHMGEEIAGPPAWAFRASVWLVAASLLTSTAIGLGVAWRLTRPRWQFWLALVLGIGLPLSLYLSALE